MSDKDTLDLFGDLAPAVVEPAIKPKKPARPAVSAAGKARAERKSSRAFRTISEVADELDVATHVLRFWESRFTSIKPMKRSGGRRYYRPEDVELLKKIRTLLYDEGYTIKGVQAFLKRGSRPTPVVEKEIVAPAPVAADSQALLADTLKQLRDIRKLLDA